MFLVILVYAWSRKNVSTNRKRQQRSFRDAYYEKKKEREQHNKTDL